MTLDPYSPCPGGIDKKIKFCCSDLLHELESLGRMIQADQRIAALEMATKLDDKHPGRACLLAARAMLETLLEKRDAAKETVGRFMQTHPDNALAVAHAATLAAADQPTEGITLLLRAMQLGHPNLPQQVYEAIGGVGMGLASRGYLIPARTLFQMQAELSQFKDEVAVKRWLTIEAEPALSLLFKDNAELTPAPPGAVWKYEFDIAFDRARKQDWPGAAEKFKALIPLAGSSPELWRNLVYLRGWLADYPGMTAALRKLAATDAPLDERVEAAAKAMLMEIAQSAMSDKEPAEGLGDMLRITFPVRNLTDLSDRLRADRQLDHIEHGAEAWAQGAAEAKSDEPPPREVYLLLDRPLPAEGDAVAAIPADKIPCIIGSVAVFGRQTDRPERLELHVARTDISRSAAQIERIGGDALGPREAEDVLQRIPWIDNGLEWQWRYPNGLPNERREAVLREERRRRLLEVWPDAADPLLAGQTLRQVAADPAQRIRALARILLIEAGDPQSPDAAAFNELRRSLGLPVADSIDPTVVDANELPPIRLHRLQMEKLDDDRLVGQYRRSLILQMRRTLVMLAGEVVKRPELNERVDMAEAHGFLARLAEDAATTLAELEQARAAAIRAKESTVQWDIAELEMRLRRGEPAEANRVLDHLHHEHINEPGVAEAIAQIFYAAGLIDEQGRPRQAAAEERPSIVLPGAEPGKLVVPGGEPAAAGAKAGGKPVIWTPGMD